MSESKDREHASVGGGEGLPERWSARRKAEIVLRLLRGEDLGEVSREIRRLASLPDVGNPPRVLRRATG
jgi:hypothetical protein